MGVVYDCSGRPEERPYNPSQIALFMARSGQEYAAAEMLGGFLEAERHGHGEIPGGVVRSMIEYFDDARKGVREYQHGRSGRRLGMPVFENRFAIERTEACRGILLPDSRCGSDDLAYRLATMRDALRHLGIERTLPGGGFRVVFSREEMELPSFRDVRMVVESLAPRR